MNPILPADFGVDWASAIGNFFLNFGVLDWLVNAFLERRLPPEKFAKIAGAHFHDRIVRVRKLIANGEFSTEQQIAFDQLFTRLEAVRRLRNHLAHGHMLMRVTAVGKAPVLSLSLPKDLNALEAPETWHLEFEELTKAQAELATLIEEFQKLSNDWRFEEPHIESRAET